MHGLHLPHFCVIYYVKGGAKEQGPGFARSASLQDMRVFRALGRAVGCRYNFFMDAAHDDSNAAVLAPFASIEPILQLPSDQFGGPGQ